MPELPEVETIIRQIRPKVVGKRIKAATVRDKGLRMIAPLGAEDFQLELSEQIVSGITRHGKFLVFCLSKTVVVAHLRMSGRFTVSDGQPDASPYNRLFLEFSDGSFLNFLDIRRFGTFHLVEDKNSYPGLTRLGPDALDDSLNTQIFLAKLHKRKQIIYKALLDQSVIAGVGNIYANEALFRSKISPLRPSDSLTEGEAGRLLAEVINILSTALQFKGTTLIDGSYLDSEGEGGAFRNLLKVYGKSGTPCPECNTTLEKLRISNRSVVYCKICQR